MAATPPRPLRPVGRALQLASHRFVQAGRRLGAMPCSAIGIRLRICRLGQRAMCLPPVGRRRRPIDRRAHQRMPEPHARADLDQPGSLGRPDCVGSDPESLGSAPEQGDVAERLRRRREQQPLRLRRERLNPPEEALLDAVRQRCAGEREPSRKLRRRQGAGKFQEREGVPACLGDDRLADSLI